MVDLRYLKTFIEGIRLVNNYKGKMIKNHNRVVKGGPFTYWFVKYPAYYNYLLSVIMYVFKGDVGWLDQK